MKSYMVERILLSTMTYYDDLGRSFPAYLDNTKPFWQWVTSLFDLAFCWAFRWVETSVETLV